MKQLQMRRALWLDGHGNIFVADEGNSRVRLLSKASALSSPAVTTQPRNAAVQPGQSANFCVAASGNPAPSYQWWRSTDNGTAWNKITNATKATLTFTAQLSDDGSLYIYARCQGARQSSAGYSDVEAEADPRQEDARDILCRRRRQLHGAPDQWRVGEYLGGRWPGRNRHGEKCARDAHGFHRAGRPGLSDHGERRVFG